MSKDTLTTTDISVHAELLRTRALLRTLLDALLDDGYTFYQNGPMNEWWQEELRRPKVEA